MPASRARRRKPPTPPARLRRSPPRSADVRAAPRRLEGRRSVRSLHPPESLPPPGNAPPARSASRGNILQPILAARLTRPSPFFARYCASDVAGERGDHQRGADAWTRQDADAFLATVDPDVEWEDAMFWTEPMRVYRGRQEVREWFERALVEPWESFRLEVEEVIPAGEDRVVAGDSSQGVAGAAAQRRRSTAGRSSGSRMD